MQHTTNYNFSLPEGDDIINPESRTGYNGNFTSIDTTLKSVSNKANANESDITDLQEDITDLQDDVAELGNKTGEDIPYESGSEDSVSDKIAILYQKLNGVETRTLLWTNPNPTSVFAPQTIALDLSGYDEVEISYLQNNSWGGRIEYHRATVGTSSGSHAQAHQINAERSYSISNNGITFNVGRKYATYGGAPTDDNSYMIPQVIYGIKTISL